MARPQQRELARNEKVPGLSPDASESELSGRPDLDDKGETGPIPSDNLPGHHPADEQDKPDGAAFLAKLQGEGRPRKKAAAKKTPAAKQTSAAKQTAAAKSKAASKKAPTAKKASAPVKKVGSPVEAAPSPVPAAPADLPSGAAVTTRTPVAAASPQASTTSVNGLDLNDVRDVAVKLVFWPVTVGVWAGKQVWRRLQER